MDCSSQHGFVCLCDEIAAAAAVQCSSDPSAGAPSSSLLLFNWGGDPAQVGEQATYNCGERRFRDDFTRVKIICGKEGWLGIITIF